MSEQQIGILILKSLKRALLPASVLLGLTLLAGCGASMAEQFERARSAGTITALDQFVAGNPEHPYAKEIQELQDDIRFKGAQSEGSVAALESYLKDFPEGKNSEAAKAQLDDLRFAAAEKKGDLDAYKGYVEKHPQGKHFKAARQVIGEAELGELEKSGTTEQLIDWLKGTGLGSALKDRGFRLLDKKAQEEAGGAGLIRFPKVKKDKMVGYSWIKGYAGGRLLELGDAKLKTPEQLAWKVQGKGAKQVVKGPELKGNLTVKLGSEELSAEPVSLVALLKVEGKSYLASQPLKLNVKALTKKPAAVNAKLAWVEPPTGAGKAKIHLFLVQGALSKKASELRPISNIVIRTCQVVLPPGLAKPEAKKEPPAPREEPAAEVKEEAPEKETATEEKEQPAAEEKEQPAAEEKEQPAAEEKD